MIFVYLGWCSNCDSNLTLRRPKDKRGLNHILERERYGYIEGLDPIRKRYGYMVK